MEKALQNENLSIVVNSFGGALSSIRDKEGTEYLWQGDKGGDWRWQGNLYAKARHCEKEGICAGEGRW